MSTTTSGTMPELIYLFKVDKLVEEAVKGLLAAPEAPSHVRVATLAPLSNYGFRPEAVATILQFSDRGLVFGSPEYSEVPRAFVPWTNISYVADGTTLGRRQEDVERGKTGARGFTVNP